MIQKLYIQYITNFSKNNTGEYDYYTPVTLRCDAYPVRSQRNMCVSYKGNRGLVEIRFSIPFGELAELTIISCDTIQFFEKDMPRYQLLISTIPVSLAFQDLFLQSIDSGMRFVDEKGLCSLSVYNNGLLITLTEQLLDNAALVFKYSSRLDVITDQDCIVIGFVWHEISEQERSVLKEYAASEKRMTTNTNIQPMQFLRKNSMLRAQDIKQALLSFKQINFGRFLEYGWQRLLLSDADIIVCAEYLIEHGKALDDSLILELAAIVGDNKTQKIEEIFQQSAIGKQIDLEDAYTYNKLWMYLSFYTETAAYRN